MDRKNFNRRDFLKLLLLLPLAANRSRLSSPASILSSIGSSGDQPNIFLFLFDTLSARNISLYGYPRETMPNLARFAEKATVYHQHHSGGNWTPTGTASLLTGTYPWTHRSLSVYSQVLDSVEEKNIFNLVKGSRHTLAYTQNLLVNSLLYQFRGSIDELIDWEAAGVYNFRPEGILFNNDFSNGFWGQNIVQGTWDLPASSPFLSILNEIRFTIKYRLMRKDLAVEYPYGISLILPGIYAFLDEAIGWLKNQIPNTILPTLSYYHFFPPHHPYSPRVEYSQLFDDGWQPPDKPNHAFATGGSPEFLLQERRKYDQFIANVDDEFGTVLELLENLGLMENSYIIFTSDHGESLERGIWGHVNSLLYEPLTHIPLLIHSPGQTKREDVFAPTSAVDLLPTICQITGQQVPDWAEGDVLPGFRTDPVDPLRPIFCVEAKDNSKFGPLTIATVAMIKWPYKLIHYFGYEQLPYHFELYDLQSDPEELNDLYPARPAIAIEMERELLAKLDEVNQTYSGDV